MKLPLVEEVAAARAAFARAQQAALDLAEVRVLRATRSAGGARPSAGGAGWAGDDLGARADEDLRRIAARWPELDPAALEAELAAVGARLPELGERLHELQHAQQDRLRAPEYDRDRAAIEALTARQAELLDAVTAPSRAAAVLQPLLTQLDAGLARIDAPETPEAVRQALIRALVEGARAATAAVGIEIGAPPTDRAALLALVDRLREQAARARERQSTLGAELDQVRNQLLERLG